MAATPAILPAECARAPTVGAGGTAASMHALFLRFSDADQRMTCGQAIEFARECGLLDGTALSTADIDLHFVRTKLAGRRSIGEPQFVDLLRQLATRKGCSLAELVEQAEEACPTFVMPGGGPVIVAGTTKEGARAAATARKGRASLTAARSSAAGDPPDAAAISLAAALAAAEMAEAADLKEALIGRPFYYHQLGLDTINRSLNKKPVLVDLSKAVSLGDVTALTAMTSEQPTLGKGASGAGATSSARGGAVKEGAVDAQGTVVVKAGWLIKQGAMVKNWKKRWFVLRSARGEQGDVLTYYNRKEDERALGQVVLDANSLITGMHVSSVVAGARRVASDISDLGTSGLSQSGSLRGEGEGGVTSPRGGGGGAGGGGGGADKRDRDFEFTISRLKAGKSKARTYRLCAASHHELMAWVDVLRAAVEGRMQSTWMADDVEGEMAETGATQGGAGAAAAAAPVAGADPKLLSSAADTSATGGAVKDTKDTFRDLWHDAGIRGFVAYFQVLKRNDRGKLQPRIFELNFLNRTLHNTWRGESRRTFTFAELRGAALLAPEPSAESPGADPGTEITTSGRSPPRTSRLGGLLGGGHETGAESAAELGIAEQLAVLDLNPGECALELTLRDSDKHRPWVLVCESRLCRDRLLAFLRAAVACGVEGNSADAPPLLPLTSDSSRAGAGAGGVATVIAGQSNEQKRSTARLLRSHVRSLVLRCGYLTRRHTPEEKGDMLQAATAAFSGSERLWMVLEDDSLRGFPSPQEASGRPWFTSEGLRGVKITKIASQSLLMVGRATFLAATPADCEAWHEALVAAAKLDDRLESGGVGKGAVARELEWRRVQGAAYCGIIDRLRTLLESKPDVDATAPGSAGAKAAAAAAAAAVTAEEKAAAASAAAAAAAAAALAVTDGMREGSDEALSVETMLRQLWARMWPGDAWEGVRGEKWSQLGFQRGGPASDLRGSGRLGLHLLLHFVENYRALFDATVASQKKVEEEGRLMSYPVTTACINIAALMVELFGLGDSGSRTGGSSAAAAQGFAALVCRLLVAEGRSVAEFAFEHAFALFVPLLDRVFLTIEAGYMEFGVVLTILKGLMERTFASQPRSLEHMAALAEGCFLDWEQRRQRSLDEASGK